MKKSNVAKMFFVFSAVSVFLFTGCKGISLDSGGGSDCSVEYGSLSIAKDVNRSMDASEISKVKVTVSGTDITVPLTAEGTASGGKTDITVEKIPVGKNRILALQAYNGANEIEGAVMYAVTDIKSGHNSVAVNWTTGKIGKVYNALLAKGVDISALTDTDKANLEAAIPDDTHSVLIDADSIANDYKAGSFKSAENYILKHGTVSVSAKKVSGYTVQVTDIASKLKKVSAPSEDFDLAACPGTWKVRVLDGTGKVVAEKQIPVTSEKTTKVSVGYVDASNLGGKTIVFVKSASAPHIWAWEEGGVKLSEAVGGTWGKSSAATKMVPATAEYMKNPSGWYMIDYTAYATGKVIKFKLNWSGSEITGKSGTFWYDGTSASSENPSPAPAGITITVGEPEIPPAPFKIYVSGDSAPDIWAWEEGGGVELSKAAGGTWGTGSTATKMITATDMNDPSGWYMIDYTAHATGKVVKFILDWSGSGITGKASTFWYDAKGVSGAAGTFYDADPTTLPVPTAPTVSITPATGKSVPLNGSVTVKLSNGNSVITAASVTISGDVSKTYAYADFTDDVLTIPVKSLGAAQGSNITVTANVTNSERTASDTSVLTIAAELTDFFTWDNLLCYFVLTDRFANGDNKNDYSYYRTNQSKNSAVPDVATFHGGDIKGLTEKLDYLNKLGVNAVWITAPYEQMHGWCTGGKPFPHFAFHGYYTQDWTFMDQNMGTVEEFRTFVTEAHKRGIRVVMDVVMNHTGYNTIEDMITYGFGKTSVTQHGWVDGGATWGNNHTQTDYTSADWSKWWSGWARGFEGKFGFAAPGDDDLLMSLAGLPDIITEKADKVAIPAFLKTKWAVELHKQDVVDNGNTTGNKFVDYQLSSIENVDWYGQTGDWRVDNRGAPADYIVMWLSAWVREFGIDGFRCDTAKHVHMYRWGQLKDACQSALTTWRADSSKLDDSGAKDWDENFWMTGECFGWISIAGTGDYYSTGKFDSMINFSFNGRSGGIGNTPTESEWGSYMNINENTDSDGNGNRNNVLTYVSSHDTGLHRPGDQKLVGTRLVLLPGGVQIYYGDESARPVCNGGGDKDMETRGDMNFGANGDCVAHWGKLGTFRKFNPAVGAGKGSATKRIYNGAAGENKVAIGVNGTSVDVNGLFADGTTVYNWYDGASAAVSGGKVIFAGGTNSQPILVSDRNPSDCGVTF